MSCVFLQPGIVLVVDVIDLALAHKNVFTTTFDASESTIPIRHFFCVLGRCLMSGAACTVADLAGPGLLRREYSRNCKQRQRRKTKNCFLHRLPPLDRRDLAA